MLDNKNILLGVCGSIASYKSALLVRLLVKAGANVKVIMTKDALSFITPLTLSTLSKNEVLFNYYDEKTGNWNNHVDLALWADLIVIAPITANTLAKFANGICDNLITATYLSAKSPVYFAPAMDLDMWQHPSTSNNVNQLLNFGNLLISPGFGELASGLNGEGRMAEPEEIVEFIIDKFTKQPLNGKKALVTAGPTYEQIDPVRFIGNHSSGKMGFALAEELNNLGAEVVLICGPTHQVTKLKNISRIDVTSAEEMLNACLANFDSYDICIMSAAVADYKALNIAPEKIKKSDDIFNIALQRTTDILQTLGKKKTKKQVLVGFALETHNEEIFAKEKLVKKNADFIVLNSLNDEGAGFKGDNNKIKIIDRDFKITSYELKPKKEVAKDICQKILELIEI